jgi:cytochrome c oxidase assembly protein subunit 15
VIWLHRYARVLAAATLLLVAAGGMVTSTNSGLSVPDWPTTYGRQMFSFPFSQMVGGIFYEHGHRLIASVVGLLTIGLALGLWRAESRPWVRRLGWIAVAAVVAQGVLGGLTVIYLLPDAISISHAGLAQIFFSLTVSLALFTSPTWRRPPTAPADDPGLRRLLVVTTLLVYGQILLGATMRHTGAGLAIPDFPLAFGRLVPPFWSSGIALHFAHRMGAVVVTVLVAMAIARIVRRHGARAELVRPAWLLAAAVAVQVTLGAFVVLTGKQPVVNTLHVATGSVVLATSLLLTLRAFRVRFSAAMPAYAAPPLPTAAASAGRRPASEPR